MGCIPAQELINMPVTSRILLELRSPMKSWHPAYGTPLPSWSLTRTIAGLLCGLAILAPVSGWAQEAEGEVENPRYFYKGLSYGSDASFNPISELINGAFGVLQINSNWVTLDQIDWGHGLNLTWRSITHPGQAVDAYGRTEFLTNEVVPGQFRWHGLQYVPNYTLHLIGGGARHRAFVEWYDAHHFALPGVWAWATTIAHAFAVEAVEHHSSGRQYSVDPVADMLIFDPAGAILFSFDGVSRFFSHTLNMSIWSGQPMYNPVVNTFENAGQNYGLHFFFGKNHPVGLFSYWGMSDLFGFTLRRKAGLDWSVGAGAIVAELHQEDRGTGMSAFYARLQWDAGLFLHENGSLLASVHVSEAWTQRLRVNMYPGMMSWKGMSPGLYVGLRGSEPIFGLTFVSTPVGLAVSEQH
jgi:hypothetical protein